MPDTLSLLVDARIPRGIREPIGRPEGQGHLDHEGPVPVQPPLQDGFPGVTHKSIRYVGFEFALPGGHPPILDAKGEFKIVAGVVLLCRTDTPISDRQETGHQDLVGS